MVAPLIAGLAARVLLPMLGRGAITAAASAGAAEAVTVGGVGAVAAAAPVAGAWGIGAGTVASAAGGGLLTGAFRLASFSLRHPFKAAALGLGVTGALDAATNGLSTEYVAGPVARTAGSAAAAVAGGAVNVGRELVAGRDQDAAGEKIGGGDVQGAFGKAMDAAGEAMGKNGLYAAAPLFMALKLAGGGSIVQAVALGAVIAGLVKLAEMGGLQAPGLAGLFNHSAVGIPAEDVALKPVLQKNIAGFPPLGM